MEGGGVKEAGGGRILRVIPIYCGGRSFGRSEWKGGRHLHVLRKGIWDSMHEWARHEDRQLPLSHCDERRWAKSLPSLLYYFHSVCSPGSGDD